MIVVDDHITGVLTEHQAGRCLNMPPAGIRVQGRRSTPGRYFQVASPGTGWGGTDVTEPLSIIKAIDKKTAWPGLRLLLTTTTGEDSLYCVLNDDFVLEPAAMPDAVANVVERIGENCEPSLCSVLFMAGDSVKTALTKVSMGGAPVYVWPGGGITVMVDVTQLPANAFGYVPTPALVAPIEFTLTLADYLALGGHGDWVQPLAEVLTQHGGSARREKAYGIR